MKFEKPTVRKLLADAADLFNEHVFMTRSMKDIIWGYRDILLNITKTIDPDWFYTDTIGYFMNVREKLTHIILASLFLFWDLGKQCRPRSDTADQGQHCLPTGHSVKNTCKIKIGKNTLDTPKFGNGLIQWIGMEKSTSHIWVKFYGFP